MNVMITTSTFPRWKGDTMPGFVFNLAKSLLSWGCYVRVITPDDEGAKRRETMNNIPIIRYQYFWPRRLQKLCYGGGITNNLRENPLLFFQIPFLIIAQFITIFFNSIFIKYNLISAHWIFPQGLVAIAFKMFFKIPVVLTVHGGDIYYHQRGLNKFLTRFVLRKTDAVCCVSNEIKNAILQQISISKDKIHVLPMGVDPDLFSPVKKDSQIKKDLKADPLLIYVGRLTEKKGIHYLIKAMPEILEKFPKAKLIIIGYGYKERSLNKLTTELKLVDSIIFLGKASPGLISRFLASADVFIGPSIIAEDGDREGLPVTFMEAMACGCPLIVTDILGNFDLVRHQETGLMIPQKNVQAISHAVIMLLLDSELRKKIIKKSREKIENSFSWNRIASDYYTIFKKSQRQS